MSAAPPSLDTIAAALQGYDPQALRATSVNAFLARLVQPVADKQQVDLMTALDRVLAEDIVSPIDVPPHDNSAMDGYALRGSELPTDTALRLEVVGTALAGQPWSGAVGPAQCVKIMTGAVMPAGLDTVVPQEMVSAKDGVVSIAPGLIAAGDNRRLLGEDLKRGAIALARGTRLSPAALGLLASLGLGKVAVWRRPRVALFSTGDEILNVGEPAREAAVYDSNRYTLFGLLQRLGCEINDLGLVRDQPEALEAAFLHAAATADAIITSGGVSVGEADFTKATMKKLGEVAFWKIAMRPGRPMAVGRIQNAVLFGLPGNPVAVMVTFLAFVRPALLQMMGCSAAAPPLLRARSSESIRKKPGRTEYQRGTVSASPTGDLWVRTTGNQGSGVLSSMVQANGLIVLGHDQGTIEPGDEVSVLMFDGAM